MMEYIKYSRALTKLFSNKEKLRVEYADDIRRAQKEGKQREDIEAMRSLSWHEFKTIDEEISSLVTDYLIRSAKRRFVPIPSHNEEGMWEQCRIISDRFVLTSNGVSKLRSSIRLEQKERIEMILSIMAALTGIVGAATGLVAMLLN